jgi:hypothetical protein
VLVGILKLLFEGTEKLVGKLKKWAPITLGMDLLMLSLVACFTLPVVLVILGV